jgi:hypothetical protein
MLATRPNVSLGRTSQAQSSTMHAFPRVLTQVQSIVDAALQDTRSAYVVIHVHVYAYTAIMQELLFAALCL